MLALALCSLIHPATIDGGNHPPAWMAAWNGPTGRHDVGYDVAVDGKGRPVLFGLSDADSGADDFAIVAYEQDGTERWSATWNGPGNGVDYCWTGAADSKGRVIAMGEGRGLDGSVDTFVLGYSKNGNHRWTYTGAGPDGGYDGTGAAYSLTLDRDDNVVVSHYQWSSTSSYDVATAKIAPDGTLLWKQVYDSGSNGYDAPYGVEVDAAGNVYVQITSYNSGNGSYDLGALKYSPDGTLLWDTLVPTPDYELGYVIAVDRWQEVYLGGLVSKPGASDDLLVAKLEQDGSLAWTRTFDSSFHGDEAPFEAAVHPQGGVVMCGPSINGFTSGIFTIRYDRDGATVFADVHDQNYEWLAGDSASGIDCDLLGNVYVTGLAWNGSGRGFDGINLKYSASGLLMEENLLDAGLGDNELLFGMAIGGSRLFAAGVGQTARGDTDTLLVSWTLPAWYDPRSDAR